MLVWIHAVKLGNYNKSHVHEETSRHEAEIITVKHTIGQIFRQGNTAAGIICKLKLCNVLQASNLPWIKDVVGVVATLGRVKDDNLSRFFSIIPKLVLYLQYISSNPLLFTVLLIV